MPGVCLQVLQLRWSVVQHMLITETQWICVAAKVKNLTRKYRKVSHMLTALMSWSQINNHNRTSGNNKVN